MLKIYKVKTNSIYTCIYYNGKYYNINNCTELSGDISQVIEYKYDKKKDSFLYSLALDTQKMAEKLLLSKIKKLDIYLATIKIFSSFYNNDKMHINRSFITCEIKNIKKDYVYNLEDDLYTSIENGKTYKMMKKDNNYLLFDNLEVNKEYMTDLELTNLSAKQAIKILRKKTM